MAKQEIRWLQALACAVVTLNAAAASPEREVDTSAFVGPVPLQYGDHTVSAALANPLEVDSFSFAGVAGDSVLLQLRGLSGGIDPSVTLRDPGGSVLGTATCTGFAGTGPCSLTLLRTLPTNGSYTINTADGGSDEAGSYQLHLERYPPVWNWTGIGYGAPATADALGHPVDIDMFAFNGVAGSSVRVTVATPAVLDPHMQIWDPAGTLLYNNFCTGFAGTGPCSNSTDLNLTATGLYRVAIFDSGLDETGAYNLQVNCLFGACPLPTDALPMPIPEPTTWMLMGLGLAGIGARLRARRG